jgi:hypothetical protein
VLLVAAGLAVCGCAGESGTGGWVTVGAASPENATVSVAPGTMGARAFREDNAIVSTVEVSWGPADWMGDKLYDGFEAVVCPLDAKHEPVRKLGGVEAVLYEFNVKTVSEKGREMMRWSVPAAMMKEAWSDPANLGAGGGFHLRLAWSKRPTVDYMVLEVTFVTLKGEKFVVRKGPVSVDQQRYRWMLDRRGEQP